VKLKQPLVFVGFDRFEPGARPIRRQPPALSIRITMRILTLFVFAAGFALAANAQTVPEKPIPRVVELGKHFPLQGLAGEAEFRECLACFERVDRLSSAQEAVRRAEDIKVELIKALKVAEADKRQKARRTEFAATTAWLNGPFTRYVARWQRLIDELAPKKLPVDWAKSTVVWRIAMPGETLAAIKSMRDSRQDWLDHHAGMKNDLAKLETAAKALGAVEENRDRRQVEEYHAAFAATKGRAEAIAKREGESPESQDIARGLADRLKSLENTGAPFAPLPVRTIATAEALNLVRSVHETHQDWLDHHTTMKEDLAKLETKANEVDAAKERRAPEQEDAFYVAVDRATERAEIINQREDETAESKDYAKKLVAQLAKIE
jgi:hypothetical protein